jgi:hypothetical protein
MNLQSWMQDMLRGKRAGRFCSATGIFGQNAPVSLESAKPFMFLLFIRQVAVCLLTIVLFGIPAAVMAQTTNYYAAYGTEYAVIGSLLGDQVFPDAAVTPAGGFVVWQDNATDGDGWGLSARRVDSTLSGSLGTFRVNVQGANDQENARVALLKNGAAVFVWQGGKPSYQHIFARFMTPTNNGGFTFLTTTDLVVSTFNSSNSFQINPAVAVLNNSNVVVVWSSFNQAGTNSLQDVYAKILSPSGVTISNQFLVNQFTNYNQRTPAVAALKGGGFVVAWVSEQQRTTAPNLGTNLTINYTATTTVTPSVDIYARLYASNGLAQGNEFPVNSDFNPSAHPSLSAGSDGGFMVAWDARDMTSANNNSLDIYARPFSSTGSGGAVVRVNTYLYGDQYLPRLSSIGTNYFVIWTSLGEDGSREGIYGQFLRGTSSMVGSELRLNTSTVSQQMQPVVASDGASQFLVAWTSYTGSPYNFDLIAQRYVDVAAILQPMSAPFVYAPFVLSNGTYQVQLEVSWASLLGIAVSNYEVYVDGATTQMVVTASNIWVMTAANTLTASSSHSFAVDYVTTDGRRSPLSPSASGTTWNGSYWGSAANPIPFEWMQAHFGNSLSAWPSTAADTDGDGMSNWQEFLAGTNPTNAGSALMMSLQKSNQGFFLNWNTTPGQTYQVQMTANFASWSNVGSPRFAAGTSDSIYVGMGTVGYYRVLLLRQ